MEINIMRQAVIIIHGIGEQKPMDTLRSFVRNIVGGTIRNKPDKMSSLFELRRLQIPSKHNQPLTDFYEYYWAHHMRDTKIRTLISWCRSLLFRKPSNVSDKLLVYYYIMWVLLLMIIPIIYQAISSIFFEDNTDSLFLITKTAFILLIDYNILRVAYGTIDDAARYLNPHPDNIVQRNKIREEGINLIDALHKSKKYSRIVIVGHSLGSVIAYDLIRLYWSMSEMPKEYVSKKQDLLKQFSNNCADIFKDENLSCNSKVNKYQELQLKIWKELRECNWPWLITDFITVGSPLTHSDMLLTKNKREFTDRKMEGEYPTSPPLSKHEIYYKLNYETDRGTRSLFTPTHFVPFICTQWTNIYFPHNSLIKGDLVGGPLQRLFGEGIRDIPVGLSGLRGLLNSHTKYWQYSENQHKIDNVQHPTNALKNSMKIDCKRGKMTWPAP
ncbi:MAG: hypothetical protein QX190_04780 [Methylococcales bacterium]